MDIQSETGKRSVSIYIEGDLLTRLDRLAKKQRYSRSSLICLLVERELGRSEEKKEEGSQATVA